MSAILDSLSPNGAGEQRRTGLQNSADKLIEGTGTDDPYIQTMESFHGMGHEEMYAKVQTMVPDAIGELAQACHNISNSLPLAFGFAVLRNTISERWEGAAADAAAQATEKLAATSGQLTSSIAAIAVKLDILSSAAADVKASVPQPTSSPSVLSHLPLSPVAAEASETAREAARLEAVRKLEAIYVPNYRDVGTNVPQLPEPYTPSGVGTGSDGVSSTHGTVPHSSSPWSPTNGDSSSALGGGDASVNGEGSADVESSADAAAANTSAANADAAASQAAANQGAGPGSAAQTSAANAQNAAGTGSQSGSGAGVGGYGGTGGSSSSGSGVGGSGSAASVRRKNDRRDSESSTSGVVPGSPIPPGGAAAGAGAAAAAAAATPVKPSMSRPGMGMAPGMMGAPGRGPAGNGDGDTEHQTPSYLITVDNGNDLIGKLDPVAPPVIGA
ncbi:hypothetical protein ACFTWF_12960 [Rhodococcus sp. NPDC056960]|uniref:hypothetical protein n=1 Tax=Rhodococcus sp. NPDC056960 TaxID=3345982 RepID=UPI00363B83A5